MLRVEVAGSGVVLHSSGAAYLPEHQTLLIADAHFGKAVSFRQMGVPVPEATTGANLDQLTRTVGETGAQAIVFLGDFLHSRRSHAAQTMASLAAWREQHHQLALTLVRGNHDDRAGDPPAGLGIVVVDEPLRLGGFALCHYPTPVADAYVLAGHWHPCISVKGRAFERLRLPCFWFGDDTGAFPDNAVGVLPAFGSFTGMHRIKPREGDRIYPIADDQVRALPPLPLS